MFNDVEGKYLRGERLSLGHKFFWGERNSCETRFEYILSKIKGNRVVHVGFADHNPDVIREKLEEGKWLHKAMVDVSKRCIGVDINEEATRFVREELNLEDVVSADLLNDEIPCVFEEKWDYLVLGEMLEHVDNPVAFLSRIHDRFADVAEKIIITVPNAFYYKNFKLAWSSFENINTDHRYWFTPFTLAKVMNQAGLSVEHVGCTQDFSLPFSPDLSWWILKFHPLLRAKVVACGNLQ